MAQRRRTRRRNKAPSDKRERILEAATQLIREHGPDKTKMSAVAAIAEVSEGIIFHHFGTKRGLLLAVATRHGHAISAAMFRGLVPGQPPNTERIVRNVFEFARGQGRLQDMLIMAQDPSEANATTHATREVVVAALTQAYTLWRDAGYIETDHPDIAAALLFGMVCSGLTECFSFGKEDRYEDFISECVACIEGALGYEPEPG